MSDFVDLHVHTNCSDGCLSPTEVVQYARAKGLRALAITDHDTVAGNQEALDTGRRLKVEIVPGLELSIYVEKGELHLLGYFLDFRHPELHLIMMELREYRRRRNPLIIEKLAALGMTIDLEKIRRATNNGNVGRPHIAAAMVEKGYVSTIKEAFNLYLRKNGPAYVPKERLTVEEGIRLIRRFSGIPVLAHPHTLEFDDPRELGRFIRHLKELGLAGIEAFYLGHNRSPSSFYLELAAELDLCVTGGSDFHGLDKSGTEIGTGRGSVKLPYTMVEGLRALLPEGHPFARKKIDRLLHWLKR